MKKCGKCVNCPYIKTGNIVKASDSAYKVELKEKFDELNLTAYKEFVHFGLTSQDINNTAIPLMLKESLNNVISKSYKILIEELNKIALKTIKIPMIARTHGQPATPTTFGKEIKVYESRLKNQIQSLIKIPNNGKFGGASGNLNAHYAAFPKIDWDDFSDKFLMKIGLERSKPTTQIEHYDSLAALFDNCRRINNVLLDMCLDIWTYISHDYFKQKIIKGEVGSSAMPHKVNPIDFENAEGNIGLANSIFDFLSNKLPKSRLQRDLSDSTVLRNIGVPFGHSLISFESILKGMNKIYVNKEKIDQDIEENWIVISEAIQTILRREGYNNPYEIMKELTRKNQKIDKESLHKFIDKLEVSSAIKKELKQISPYNYTGI